MMISIFSIQKKESQKSKAGAVSAARRGRCGSVSAVRHSHLGRGYLLRNITGVCERELEKHGIIESYRHGIDGSHAAKLVGTEEETLCRLQCGFTSQRAPRSSVKQSASWSPVGYISNNSRHFTIVAYW